MSCMPSGFPQSVLYHITRYSTGHDTRLSACRELHHAGTFNMKLTTLTEPYARPRPQRGDATDYFNEINNIIQLQMSARPAELSALVSQWFDA